MNVLTAIASGLAGRTRRGITAVLLAQHAITREDAVAFVSRYPAEAREFDRLRRTGVIQDAGAGTYWLERAALDADDAARRRVLIPLTVILLLLAAIIPLFFYKDVPLISLAGG